VGQSYSPPPPTRRRGIQGDVARDEWLATLHGLGDEERARALVRGFAWTSPLNAGALLGAATERDGGSDLDVGFERWKRLAAPDGETRPVVLRLEKRLQPYPVPLPGTPSTQAASLIDAFETCARAMGDGGEASPAAVLGPELLAGLDHRVDQARRRVTSLEAELEALPDPDRLRSVGDLILARYHEVPSGAESATLVGFDGEAVEVRLDPSEPAHVNATRYYDRAQKSERAAERLPGLLGDAYAEVARLEGLLDAVRAGTADEEEVRDVIGPLPQSSRGEPQGPALPYRSFRSSGGLEIRVGRGARHNDDLTFHHSSPGDVWLHAGQAAGAHVILRWPGPGNPPARDLHEAANLAALHSKARTSGSVPVDWTLRKYVRKPRKSPPGRVSAERVETVFVEPNEALLDTLAERPGAD
jgi:predicted ribosome quality control (RQC) complex YloA/Tae2 family protein